MSLDPRTPVIIGVGQAEQRPHGLEDAREPVDLIADAVRAAAQDAGLAGVPRPDSVRVVRVLSWKYYDLGLVLAERLGFGPYDGETAVTPSSGNSPQLVVNTTAEEILAGRLELAVVAGGETWRTRMRARRGGDVRLEWTKQPKDLAPRLIGDEVSFFAPWEIELGLVEPVTYYPIFESALRAARGETPEAHLVKVSELWSRFSRVAAANPHAWIRAAMSPEEIRTPGPSNRMIGLPYTKVMNSNNDVEMSAAIIMCSLERARALGVPDDRLVFPWAGTTAHDTYVTGERLALHRSPAIRVAGTRALAMAGVGMDDIAHIDLYSCFPSMVQMSAGELGLALDDPRGLTVTGGLSFNGGPWNNYVSHAIATMVGRLREQPGAVGFVHANGGNATKHSFGVYSTAPPPSPFRHEVPQGDVDAAGPTRALATGADAAGPAVIEGYTVMHDRDGEPVRAFMGGLRADGARAWGVSDDAGLAAAMCTGEWAGRTVTVGPDGRFRP